MPVLTVDELERFAEHDTLTQDELEDLRRRAESEPDVWMITPGVAAYVHDPAPLHNCGFWHRPTGKNYGFAYAPLNKVWFRTPDREQA